TSGAKAVTDWFAEELTDNHRREYRRLARRALARPWRTFGIALALALALAAHRVRTPPSFTARIVLRVSEGDLENDVAPAPNRQLREYVSDVVFSNDRLLGLMRTYHLSPKQLVHDPSQAVDDLRENIQIEVWRNYFLDNREPGQPRSARLAIEFTAGN